MTLLRVTSLIRVRCQPCANRNDVWTLAYDLIAEISIEFLIRVLSAASESVGLVRKPRSRNEGATSLGFLDTI